MAWITRNDRFDRSILTGYQTESAIWSFRCWTCLNVIEKESGPGFPATELPGTAQCGDTFYRLTWRYFAPQLPQSLELAQVGCIVCNSAFKPLRHQKPIHVRDNQKRRQATSDRRGPFVPFSCTVPKMARQRHPRPIPHSRFSLPSVLLDSYILCRWVSPRFGHPAADLAAAPDPFGLNRPTQKALSQSAHRTAPPAQAKAGFIPSPGHRVRPRIAGCKQLPRDGRPDLRNTPSIRPKIPSVPPSPTSRPQPPPEQ